MFWQKRYGAAAEFTVFIPDFKKGQDVRLKVGYEILDKVMIIIFLVKESIIHCLIYEPYTYCDAVIMLMN